MDINNLLTGQKQIELCITVEKRALTGKLSSSKILDNFVF